MVVAGDPLEGLSYSRAAHWQKAIAPEDSTSTSVLRWTDSPRSLPFLETPSYALAWHPIWHTHLIAMTISWVVKWLHPLRIQFLNVISLRNTQMHRHYFLPPMLRIYRPSIGWDSHWYLDSNSQVLNQFEVHLWQTILLLNVKSGKYLYRSVYCWISYRNRAFSIQHNISFGSWTRLYTFNDKKPIPWNFWRHTLHLLFQSLQHPWNFSFFSFYIIVFDFT